MLNMVASPMSIWAVDESPVSEVDIVGLGILMKIHPNTTRAEFKVGRCSLIPAETRVDDALVS